MESDSEQLSQATHETARILSEHIQASEGATRESAQMLFDRERTRQEIEMALPPRQVQPILRFEKDTEPQQFVIHIVIHE